MIRLITTDSNLFGTHVVWCAYERARYGYTLVFQHACDTKVHKTQPPVIAQHKVGWLDVSMDDALAMGIGKGIGYIGYQPGNGVIVSLQ